MNLVIFNCDQGSNPCRRTIFSHDLKIDVSVFCMIIDSHTHIGEDTINFYLGEEPESQTAEQLAKKMKANGVDRAVIFACPAPIYYDPHSADSMDGPLEPSGLDLYPYRMENHDILNAARKYAQFIPYLCVQPQSNRNMKGVEEQVKANRNVRGMKFHGLAMHTPTIDLIGSRIMRMADEHDLAVLVHSDATGRFGGYASKYSHPVLAVELARAHPDVNVIAAHLGSLENKFLEALSSLPNLFTDTGPYVHLVKKIGGWKGPHRDISKIKPHRLLEDLDREFPHKILWSSDEPWTVLSGTGYKEEVGILNQLPDAVKYRIAEENITRVLKI